MKALVGAFNQKALVGAFSVIVKPMDRFTALVVTRKYPAAVQQTANISYTLPELLLHTFVSLYTSFVFCLAGIWNPTYSGKCVAHRVFDSRHPLLLLWQQIVLPHLHTRRTRWSGDTG